MKIKDYQCKCGCNDFFFADKGNQKGIYCSYCGKWLKWADKDEQNLRMKQVSVLDKIRAEIADLDAKYEFAGYYKAVNDALQIIDKYIVEREVSDADSD